METLAKSTFCTSSSIVEEQLSSPICILVVDDYEDWRRQTCRLLQGRPEFRVVCEAADGSEAVQRAEELKPDLILLDIGLPLLNGIEAAQQIRRLSPNSKIAFVSLYDSPDVVQAALSTGALGYVRKTDAASELLTAVDAVLSGKRFVSSSLKDFKFTDSSPVKASCCHEVQFYSDDAVLLDRLVPFVAAALKAGNAAIVAATASHRHHLNQRLRAEGLDVEAVIDEGRYVPVGVADTYPAFMVNDLPDATQFFEVVDPLVQAAAKAVKTAHPRVAIFGEWASHLLAEGKKHAVIPLEQLGNQLAATYNVDILCGYALSSFYGEEGDRAIQRICAEHSAAFSQ